MYSLLEIRDFRKYAIDNNFKFSDSFLFRSEKELQSICNGIGPEFFPEKIRKKISKIFPKFLAQAGCHDEHYACLVKTLKEFHKANSFFRYNCMLEVQKISIFHPIEKLILYLEVRFLYRMVKLYGWRAFLDA